jgi:hypothetical protein
MLRGVAWLSTPDLATFNRCYENLALTPSILKARFLARQTNIIEMFIVVFSLSFWSK